MFGRYVWNRPNIEYNALLPWFEPSAMFFGKFIGSEYGVDVGYPFCNKINEMVIKITVEDVENNLKFEGQDTINESNKYIRLFFSTK